MMTPGGLIIGVAMGALLAAIDPARVAANVMPVGSGIRAGQEVLANSAAQDPPQPATPRPNINPYDRDIAMTVPLNFNRRVLGELPVILTKDDRFIVDSEGFIRLINPLLTEAAQADLTASLQGNTQFAPDEINAAGIQLDYDPTQLAVLVLRIDPTRRVPESLFTGGQSEPAEQGPEDFSAYLNSNISVSRRHSTGDIDAPSVFLNGAARYKNVVFEADVQGRQVPFTDNYEVQRRYARFVYDEPKDYRRWYLGDMDPETRGRQGFIEMGGVGVSRQKRRFDSFRNNVLSGGRELILQESSVVRVSRNGVFVREFRLDPGQYDVSNLPLDAGSNDVEIEVVGESGRRETIGYSAYLDSIDLEPGDYEYGAFLGATSNSFFGQPDYSAGELAFTGFYRKAFENRPAIGLGLQASEDVQSLTGQTQFILANGSRLQLDGSTSNSSFVGQGYAFAASYEYIIDVGDDPSALVIVADFTSEDYATLGNRFADNPTSWAFSAGYTYRFSTDWIANLSASYRMSRDTSRGDAYSANLSSTYRVTPQWSTQVGLEYSDFGASRGPSGIDGGSNFGATFAVIWTPAYNHRGEARYNSAQDSGSLRFQQNGANQVDSFGYSVASNYAAGSGSLSGQIDYSGNRFDATVAHAAFGRSFSNITEEQVTSVRVGTSIATAGGKVAIGRTIYDSFAIVYPHETLKPHDVLVGESLEGGRYTARSGAFGPALANTLTSYVNQNVRYDAINAPLGYDVGDGVKRVRPGYRSGYAIEVGSAKFVSALGRLVGNSNRSLALMSGRVRSIDDPTAEPELFFTNSVGRFAIQNLEPGKRYRIELFSTPAFALDFTVPENNEGLLDLEVLTVPLDVPE